MKRLIILVFSTFIICTAFKHSAKAQVFYIGLNAGPTYSWYKAPPSDIDITSNGWGSNLGFFLRYGKRPYYQVGFDWTRANNDFTVSIPSEGFSIEDKVPFHNFDFSVKVGYEVIQTPYFKWSVFAGPFIGRSLLFESNDFNFEKSDFQNPQYGIIGGTGIQITNFIMSFDYNLHLSGLFKPVDVDGYNVNFNGNLQIVSIKVGVQL